MCLWIYVLENPTRTCPWLARTERTWNMLICAYIHVYICLRVFIHIGTRKLDAYLPVALYTQRAPDGHLHAHIYTWHLHIYIYVWMYVYMYTYCRARRWHEHGVYIYIYIYTYIYIHIQDSCIGFGQYCVEKCVVGGLVYIYIYIYTYIYIHTPIYIHIYIFLGFVRWVQAVLCWRVRSKWASIYIYTYIYIHTYIYVHTYIYIYKYI